jgi:hypothetical protein
MVKPEKMSQSSGHEHLEGAALALAKLLRTATEKPAQFVLPHAIILLLAVFAFSWRRISKAFRIKAPVES